MNGCASKLRWKFNFGHPNLKLTTTWWTILNQVHFASWTWVRERLKLLFLSLFWIPFTRMSTVKNHVFLESICFLLCLSKLAATFSGSSLRQASKYLPFRFHLIEKSNYIEMTLMPLSILLTLFPIKHTSWWQEKAGFLKFWDSNKVKLFTDAYQPIP
jgi:hypothetical protein